VEDGAGWLGAAPQAGEQAKIMPMIPAESALASNMIC
jgi:hypothetical protein